MPPKKKQAIEPANTFKNSHPVDHFVVGIGASAGGLDALQEFFDNIPSNTGITYCILQHLSPNFKSLMDELLSKHTKMKITTAVDGEPLEPNRVYLNPNESSIIIKNGRFNYVPKEKRGTLNLPIDLFLHSLANEYQEKSIAVILSGTGTDGSRGIKTIKEVGGTIMVQDPQSAQFDGMPNSAISTGLAEYVNNPAGLAQELIKFPSKPSFMHNVNKGGSASETEIIFEKILEEIHKVTGIDFKQYKNSTLVRRLEKRLSVLNITNISDYYELVKKSDDERHILMKDFFIGVTNFFRDKAAFDVIKETILPEIFSEKKPSDVVRLWSVGCSTGEEAYSLAIILDEYISENKLKNDYKIFATDTDIDALEKASNGEYLLNMVNDISAKRLEQYFIRIADKYQVIKRIREKIIFSRHNIIKDPPFIRMDLISCRNLLIYLLPRTQKKVFQHFQFSLNLHGILFLGNSENLGDLQKDFDVINAKWRIFSSQVKPKILPSIDHNENNRNVEVVNSLFHNTGRVNKQNLKSENLFVSHLCDTFSPKCIFIDSDYNILYIKGDLGDYLNIPQGVVQMNLLKMVDINFAAIIRNGIRRLNEENKEVIFNNINNLLINNEKSINLKFTKVEKENHLMYLIVFDETKSPNTDKTIVYDQYELAEFSKQRIEDLEGELKRKQEELQYVIEELETSNEELQAANEELMASNEELQGTNEELQSVNEELYTVNTELQAKNKELVDVSNDLTNLINSTQIGTLFLDGDLKIRKFTPAMKIHFDLQDSDVNRPIAAFSYKFAVKSRRDLIADINNVITSKKAYESQLSNSLGKTYLKRIIPFVTQNNVIDGVVITYVDITNIKKTELALQHSNEKLKALSDELELILDNFPGLIFYKDNKNNYLRVNKYVADRHNCKKEDLNGKNLFDIYSKEVAQHYWDDDLEVINSGESKHIIEQWETNEGVRWVETNKILIKNNADNTYNILGVSKDITDKKLVEDSLNETLNQLKLSNQELSQFAFIASHDLQEPLNTIVGLLDFYIDENKDALNEESREYFKLISESTYRMKQLIRDLLEYSRLGRTKELVEFSCKNIVEKVIEDMNTTIHENNANIITDNLPANMKGFLTEFRLLIQNLFSNAIKFRKKDVNPIIKISCDEDANFWKFSVTDNGIGIDDHYFDKIFVIFQRLHSRQEYQGNGIGLAHCKKVVELHQGRISVESEVGEGTTFHFTISKNIHI